MSDHFSLDTQFKSAPKDLPGPGRKTQKGKNG